MTKNTWSIVKGGKMSGGDYHQQNKGPVQGQNIGTGNNITQHFYGSPRWLIALLCICVLVIVLFFGIYKIIVPPSPSLSTSPSPSLSLSPSTSSSSSSSSSPSLQENKTFTCVSGCVNSITTTLDTLSVDQTTHELMWNFTVKNTGPITCEMSFSPLILTNDQSQSEYQAPTKHIDKFLLPNESTPISLSFVNAPLTGQLDLRLGINTGCPTIGSGNSYSIGYQTESFAVHGLG